ncbi:protein YhfH [Brevibacillus ginsengisoli]|uniref:protein YhfH n=1 Tax=Brevibacillus ginsengisoli TaxID=363854 RepID=UPI003CEDDF00
MHSANFYHALPDKVCSVCHEKLHEQAEAYTNVCPSCLHTHGQVVKPLNSHKS